MKIRLLLISLFLSVFLDAQRVDLRKLVMNSDVIVYVELNDFEIYSKNINDHFSESYLKIKSYQKVVKNDSDINFVNQEIFEPTEGNDFYNDSELNEGGCDALGEIAEPNRKYYSLIFLERNKKRLSVLGGH